VADESGSGQPGSKLPRGRLNRVMKVSIVRLVAAIAIQIADVV
jgi:hypothetical protein